jgi:nucleoside recognition membrane protein YjiH
MFLIVIGYIILIQPVSIFADRYTTSDSLQPSTLLSESQINNQINSSRFDSSFLPIVITSVIVIGVLIFAMWQTIRSRKQF